jgi:hypothetical protein
VRTGVDVETSGSAAVRATVPASAAVQSRVLPACLGLLIAAIGNVLADVATFMAARLAGGARGCDVDLDTGGRGAVLFAMVLAYPSATSFSAASPQAGLRCLVRPSCGYRAALVTSRSWTQIERAWPRCRAEASRRYVGDVLGFG